MSSIYCTARLPVSQPCGIAIDQSTNLRHPTTFCCCRAQTIADLCVFVYYTLHVCESNWLLSCMRFIPEIRHPEEMSLSRRLDSRELKKNQGVSATRRPARPGYNSPNHHHHLSSNSLDNGVPGSPSKSPYNPATPQVRTSFQRSKACSYFRCL